MLAYADVCLRMQAWVSNAVGHELDVATTLVVTVESVEMEAPDTLSARLYVSGDYLEMEEEDDISSLSSPALPASSRIEFHHHLPFSLSPSTPEGARNRRLLLACLGEAGEGKAMLRLLLCAEGEQEEAWEVASCLVCLWRNSPLIPPGCSYADVR